MKKFLLIGAVIAVIALVVKKLAGSRDDWTDLTEDEARQRLHDRFPDRMPEDKKEVVTDKIVSKMKEKGAIIDLTDTPDAEQPAAAVDLGGTAATVAEETASTN